MPAARLGLGLGLLTPSQILHIDAGRYSAAGLIVEGATPAELADGGVDEAAVSPARFRD